MKNEPFSLELLSAKKPALLSVPLKRDQCVVIYSNPGNPATFKKHMKAVRASLKGKPYAEDPAIELRRTRDERGLV